MEAFIYNIYIYVHNVDLYVGQQLTLRYQCSFEDGAGSQIPRSYAWDLDRFGSSWSGCVNLCQHEKKKQFGIRAKKERTLW
jgi:hypothetical protein